MKDNVRMVHEEAIKPDPLYAKRPLEWFDKRLIKTSFQDVGGFVEHMWVKVTGTDGVDLMGVLENDPLIAKHLNAGDPVTVKRCHVEAVNLSIEEWWEEVATLRAKADFYNRYLGQPTPGSGFEDFFDEHFTPRQALNRWSSWSPDEEDPLRFLLATYRKRA